MAQRPAVVGVLVALALEACGGRTILDVGSPDAGSSACSACTSLAGGAEAGSAGSNERDAGRPSVDAGLDAGKPSVDAGLDAGPPSVDAGLDAGPPSVDAGFDAGKPSCTSKADCPTGNFCWLQKCVRPVAIAAGANHTCALTSAGDVQCWGDNDFGQLGDGSYSASPTPVASVVSNAIAIAAGGFETCAIVSDGSVECWGANDLGELGDSAFYGTSSALPLPVGDPTAPLGSITAIAVGNKHACALAKTGEAECWGDNDFGQLGSGAASSFKRSPVEVSLPQITAISAGYMHSCALTRDGSVACWGSNSHGQSGGAGDDYPAPNPVGPWSDLPSSDVIALAAGDDHSCALTQDGAVGCWGNNANGELGNGSYSECCKGPGTPLAVSGLSSVSAIAAGDSHTCALTSSGMVWCWGWGVDGELGDGSSFKSSVPVSVKLSASATAIAASGDHTCALETTGDIECWGSSITVFGSSVPEKVNEP